MKKILLLISLLASLTCAQSPGIKQITNLNADCRKLTAGRYGILSTSPYFIFEAHSGNSSSIYLGRYYSAADSFAVIMNVTNDNFININPQLIYTSDSLIIIYQTNKNGNWDIVYNIYRNNLLSPVYYAANSPVDEVNPVVSYANQGWSYDQYYYVSYERVNSVYIKDLYTPSAGETEVYRGNDSTKYGQVSQESPLLYGNYYMAARKVVNNKSSIVYKKLGTNGWENEIELVNSGNCHNPRILNMNNQHYFSYTNDAEGKNNIYMIQNFYQPVDSVKLFDNPQFDYDNFLVQQPYIFTREKELYIFNPHSYTASRNDSLFIGLNNGVEGFNLPDTMVYTKVKNNNLNLCSFGFTYPFEIFYSVWEDSINGKIQIFGRKLPYIITSVKNENSPSDFTLYQNYPNPFNPATTISYRLKEKGFVKLDVYDTKGSLIKTLVNQTKEPGIYETEFNAKGLPSGIYFYRLEVFGNASSPAYSEIKKLVLLK